MYDVIVIGSGPAGMMASISAGENGRRVLLIEKNDNIGKKLKLTGGTRCNVTNLKTVTDFINEIPVNNKTLYSSLSKFGPREIYDYLQSIGVNLKVEDNDRVFPMSNKATTIIEALKRELDNYQVEIHLNESVESIEINDNIKKVITNVGKYETAKIIIATGGKSYPHAGSTGDGYNLASMLKQPVTNLYPAETFLITKQEYPLAGTTVDDVKITLNRSVTGSMLFTHKGISGPAVFKISEEVYKELELKKEPTITIDFIKDHKAETLLNELNNYDSKKEIKSFFKQYLSKRLVDFLIQDDRLIATISKANRLDIINNLKNYKMDIKETGTIEQSFVTGGGIDIKYINPKTMESTINKGIYFVGEVLNIHGHTGGYNITIALSTGYAAGKDI